jgi:hypothetical protein
MTEDFSLDDARAEDERDSEEATDETQLKDAPAPFGDHDGERVGHVTAQDNPIVVDREESIIRAFVDSDSREGVRLGNYLRIPYAPLEDEEYPRAMLVGVIKRLEYATIADINDKQDGGYANPPGEHSFSYVAQIEPISIVEFDETDTENQFTQATVDKPPKPGANTYLVENRAFLRSALRLPDRGVFLGHMAVSGDRIPTEEEPLPYYMFNPNATDGNKDEGEPAIFRHTQVAGSTGQGKTHGSKNILRNLSTGKEYSIEVPPEEQDGENVDVVEDRQRALNVTVIDPEGEYVEMGDDPDPETQADYYEDEFQEMLEEQNILHGGLDSPDSNVDFGVYVPNINDTHPSHPNCTEFSIPFELVRRNRQLLYKSSPPDRTKDAINDLITEYFHNHNAPYTYSEFSNFAENMLAEDEDSITENGSVKTAARERLVDQYEFNRVFDNGDQSLFDLTNEMFSPGKVTIIPTDHLRGSTDRLVVSCLLAHVVTNKIGSDVEFPHIKGTPMLLSLDEAHEYLITPSDLGSRSGYLVRKFRQAAKRGRKDKFGLYIITQTPQDIDEDVRKQMNTRIYLGLERDVVESHDVFVPKEFKEAVTQFNKGQMVVKQPDVRAVEIKGLPACLTHHSN